MENAQIKIALAFTAGVFIGGGAGYLIAASSIRKLAEKDLEAVQDLFRSVREADAQKSKSTDEVFSEETEAERYQTPQQSIDAEEIITMNRYRTSDAAFSKVRLDPAYLGPIDDQEEEEPVRRVIHSSMNEPNSDDVTTWHRDPRHPYIITEAEYRIDRPEFEKDNLTYYSGDDILAEEDGSYIPDKNGTAGNDNLRDYFGYGSGDEHLLYIRNERVMTDFEITLNEGKFSKEVLDVDEDDDVIPPKRIIRKMRNSE